MRRKLAKAGAVALTVALCAASAAFANSHAKAPVQAGNGDCGVNHPENTVIGTASFKRAGNKVTVSVSLKGATPNTTYRIDLAGPSCGELGLLAEFKTNKKGSGHGVGSIEVPAADKEFFVDVDTQGFHGPSNDTPYVSLP